MSVLQLLDLSICALGLAAFGLLLAASLREAAEVVRGRRPLAGQPVALDMENFWLPLGLILLALLHFSIGILAAVPQVHPLSPQWLRIWAAQVAILFPPLLCASFYLERREILVRRRLWKVGIALPGLTSAAATLLILSVAAGLAQPPRLDWLAYAFQFGFAWTALFCILLVRRGRSQPDPPQRLERSPRLALYILLGFLLVMAVLINAGSALIFLLAKSMPLAFVFVALYFEHRYEFFDIAVKNGLFLMLVLGLVVGYFWLVMPVAEGFEEGTSRMLVFVLTALPLALALPAFHRRLGAWLDRIWLGRQYSAAAATKRFLAQVQSADGQEEILKRVESSLAEIFQAPVEVVPDPTRANPRSDLDSALDLPVELEGRVQALIRMGERRNRMPYFSGDVQLLHSLAELLARLLENARLQERRKDQERRERDLLLQASQSELKALRAQINPHFLFNALNAIASLIHKNPRRAEDTVEQLAEVFRYTLRRSDQEWVRLEDEMAFVSSYLEVEKARFGQRLRIRLRLDEAARSALIPSMIVQTLVENAVKHGVSLVRGPGRLEVTATIHEERLQVDVCDSGPGFEPKNASDLSAAGSGYGLKNVRKRLEGYFSQRAELLIRRDHGRGLTVVSLRMPLLRDEQAFQSPSQVKQLVRHP